MKTLLIAFLLVVVSCIVPNAAAAIVVQEPAAVEVPGVEAPARVEPPAPQEPLDGPGVANAAEGGEAGQDEAAAEGPTPRVLVRNEAVRVGSDYRLPAGEVVREVVVISGSATIEGEVVRDVVIILGEVDLTPTAVIGGDLVVVGGGATIAPGAMVDGDLVVLGDEVILPPGFEAGGEEFLAETFGFGTGFLQFVPFVTRGLLWGRLIVPELAWMWIVVAMALAVYLGLNLVFDSATRACAETISERPLSTLLAGLLALLLAGPLAFLLTVSVVGLVVVPFLFAAFLVAGVVGKVGVFRWMGGGILRQDAVDSRAFSALAVVVGFALVTLAYMVPVVGLLTWATLGSLGLGAAAIAFVRALRSENPQPPASRRAPPSPPAPADRTMDATVPEGEGGSVGAGRAAPGGGTEASAHGSAGFAPPGGPGPEAAGPPAARMDPALFPRASFLIRLGAFALDFFLAVMTFSLLGLDNVGRFLLLFLIYSIGFWAWKGATVGGIICQFRVVRVDGQNLTFSDALVRGLSSIFSFAAVGLGCLWVLWDSERQAWHDKIAGTYVVEVPRNWPLD